MKLAFRSVDFCEGTKAKGLGAEKNRRNRDEDQHKLNPVMTPGPNFQLRLHWWEPSAPTSLRHPCSSAMFTENVMAQWILDQEFGTGLTLGSLSSEDDDDAEDDAQ